MTNTHWYKGIHVEPQRAGGKAKLMARNEQVDHRLGSIMWEQNANRLLQRQQAGVDTFKGRKCHKSAPPRVCKYQQEYERNRKSQLKKLMKKQRKLTEYHPRPVPDFSKYHKRWESRNKLRQMRSINMFTKSHTPLTLIHSINASKQRLEKHREEQKLNKRPKLSTDSFDYRPRPLFVPHIESRYITAKPFEFKSEARALCRKRFDDWAKVEQETRWRRRAMEWAQRWHDEYIRLRKLTNFKANPNPFKRIKAQ